MFQDNWDDEDAEDAEKEGKWNNYFVSFPHVMYVNWCNKTKQLQLITGMTKP